MRGLSLEGAPPWQLLQQPWGESAAPQRLLRSREARSGPRWAGLAPQLDPARQRTCMFWKEGVGSCLRPSAAPGAWLPFLLPAAQRSAARLRGRPAGGTAELAALAERGGTGGRCGAVALQRQQRLAHSPWATASEPFCAAASALRGVGQRRQPHVGHLNPVPARHLPPLRSPLLVPAQVPQPRRPERCGGPGVDLPHACAAGGLPQVEPAGLHCCCVARCR